MTVDQIRINRNKKFYRCFQNYYHCHSYLDLSPQYYTDVRPSANHWQLRDMLQVDRSSGDVYYTKGDELRYINLAAPSDKNKIDRVKSEVGLALDYLPKCFHHADGGYMVTGGLITFTSTSRARSTDIPNLLAARPAGVEDKHAGGAGEGEDDDEVEDDDDDEEGRRRRRQADKVSVKHAESAASALASSLVEDLVFGGLVSKSAVRATPATMSYSSRTSKGILSFRNPAASETHTVALGELINNAVTIYKNSNLSYSLYVCNNDLNLYVVDINSRKLSLNRKINCELNTALNNVVRCPMSEKVLTVTGDSSSVFLVDPTSSNSSARIATLNTHHDSGFGVSYHPNGTTFAVSFQDGACLLYDIRNLPTKQSNGSSSTYSYAASPTSSSSGALFEFKSTRAGHPNGAFRCCKFSQTGINDMLVISEHVGRVHLIDLNKCNSSSNDQSHGNQGHQVMVLPYALDQFGSFEKQKLTRTKGKGEEETDFHFKIPVYGDDEDETGESSGFSVPLVYDYDYLVNSYPNLFKDYSYSPIDTNEYADNGGAFKFHQNPDQWVPFGHNQTNLTSISEDFDYYNESSPRSNSTLGEPFPCHSHISANANHINGEINLAGIDWLGEKLLIACEDGGILSWDMNTKGRMSNGGFAYV